MKSLIKLFFYLLFILTLNHCSIIPTTIDKNILEIISLTTNETQLLLQNQDNNQKMFIDIILSHPSKYKLTFNQYDDEEHNEILNDNLFFYYNKEIINSLLLRGLSSDYSENQTSLIENDIKILGTNKITLDLSLDANDTIKNVLLYITKNEEEEEDDDDYPNEDDEKIMIKYTFINSDEKYSLNNTKIKIEQNKDNLDISVSGISYTSDIIDQLSDVTAVYSISLFDKETLESKYENLYINSFIKEEETLLSKEYEYKENNITSDKNIKLKALLNDKKEQLLLITVKLFHSDNIECYFQYEFISFKVVEISRDDELPDNEKKEEEIDYDKNRKDNLTVFIAILSCFSGIVIITFIGVFIYFYISNNLGKSNNDTQYHFKNIGQIKTLIDDDN